MPRVAGQIDVSKNEAILDAAVEVFSQRGVMASVEDIARRACPDPMQAAEFFAGMVLGSHQTATLLGVDPQLDADRIDHIATEAAIRFMRAYAV